MPAAIKLLASQYPPKPHPVLEHPMKDLEPLHVVAQIRHVFGGEGFIWKTGDGMRDMHGL